MKHITVILFFATALGSLIPDRAWSADFNKGEQAFYDKDYAAALREFVPLAKQGNKHAQLSLGIMHQHGLGVPMDHKNAADFYHLALENGATMGLTLLGQLMLDAASVMYNPKRGIILIRLAAKSGDVAAQLLIKRNTELFASAP